MQNITTYDAESPFDQLVGARERGERPVAPRADLRGADIRDADLRGADLTGINLRWADLRGADLYGADIRDADLRGINLPGADLRDADLRGADIRDSDLRGINLTGINLRGANLRWAARAARIIHIAELPSGEIIFMPTPGGWHLTVGCWEGNLEDFKNLIASDEGWPEARGAEVKRRRPSLQAVVALCEAHMCLYPKIIEELAEKWQCPTCGDCYTSRACSTSRLDTHKNPV